MNTAIRQIIYFFMLIFIQVLLVNNISIFGVNAYIYLLFILTYPINISTKIFMPICFLLGLFIDVFSDTYGIHAAASTFIAAIRPFVFKYCVGINDKSSLVTPSLNAQKGRFMLYAIIIIFAHHFVLYLLDVFSFELILPVLKKTLISSLFTFLLVISVQFFNHKSN